MIATNESTDIAKTLDFIRTNNDSIPNKVRNENLKKHQTNDREY